MNIRIAPPSQEFVDYLSAEMKRATESAALLADRLTTRGDES